jgi:hypothetical protein
MASQNFTNLCDHLARARVNYGTGTFKGIIVSSVPTETNLDTWDYRSDITNEIPATGGYVLGGFDLVAAVGAVDTVNNRLAVTFSAGTPTYESSTISGVGVIIYQDTGNAATSPLLHFVDWESVVSSTNGDFQVTFTSPFYING